MATAVSRRGIAFTTVDLTPPWRAPRAPVVFLHGVGTNREVWADWMPAIAPHHRVVTADMRGLGDSAALPDNETGLLDVLVADLLDLLPDGAPAHLVGESTGGVVALTAALTDPGRVATVTICNAPIAGRGTAVTDAWAAQLATGREAWSTQFLEDRFAPGAVDPDVLAWVDHVQRRTDPTAALALSRMLGTVDLRPAIGGLGPPLLVLLPESSPFIALEPFADLTARTPVAEVVRFPDARHGLMLSHAPACSAALLAFLRDRDRPSRAAHG